MYLAHNSKPSWNGSAIVVDAIFANNLLQFRRQLRFVPSTTDLKCHATTNHILTSVYQAATVAHPVHRAYGCGGELQEETFARVFSFPDQDPFLCTVSDQSPFLIMRIFSTSYNRVHSSLILEMTKDSAG